MRRKIIYGTFWMRSGEAPAPPFLKTMNIEQKHKISRQIVGSLSKISYYETTLTKIKRNPKIFYESTIEVRLVGVRNVVWGQITMEQSISIIKNWLKEERKKLALLEKQIK